MPTAALAGATPAFPMPPGPSSRTSVAGPVQKPGADRRAHKRHTRDEIPFVTKVRVKYGPAVTLIDLSVGGAQIQTTNFRLQPGSTVVLEISGEQGERSVPATVLRCQLASLLPEPVYRGALVFKRELDLRSLGATADQNDAHAEDDDSPEAGLDPATELTQLRQVLSRLALGPGSDEGAGALGPILAALDAAYATLDTPAGRRAGPDLSDELAELFSAVATALERTPTAAALMAAIEEHLRHVVPARAIRVADPDTFLQMPGSEAILLSVPRLSATAPAMRLAVEFPDGCEPQELHFQILKAGIQLVAIASELGRLNGPDLPLTVRPEEPLPAGWSRVVLRYHNGRMHRGFTHDFASGRGHIQLAAEPVASPESRAIVPFTELKAIVFNDDAARDPEGPAPAEGARVCVTFKDGEQLVGTTSDDSSAAPGFFLRPADAPNRRARVFVLRASTTGITLL